MIFSQYNELAYGLKTMTQRLRDPAHTAVGNTQAAVPKRGKPAWWIGMPYGLPALIHHPAAYVAAQQNDDPLPSAKANRYLADHGFIQTRIHIASKIYTPISTMTEADAQAEGCATLEEYAFLWNCINPTVRFESNPHVWRITFTRTPQFVAMFTRFRAAGGIFK